MKKFRLFNRTCYGMIDRDCALHSPFSGIIEIKLLHGIHNHKKGDVLMIGREQLIDKGIDKGI